MSQVETRRRRLHPPSFVVGPPPRQHSDPLAQRADASCKSECANRSSSDRLSTIALIRGSMWASFQPSILPSTCPTATMPIMPPEKKAANMTTAPCRHSVASGDFFASDYPLLMLQTRKYQPGFRLIWHPGVLRLYYSGDYEITRPRERHG